MDPISAFTIGELVSTSLEAAGTAAATYVAEEIVPDIAESAGELVDDALEGIGEFFGDLFD